MDLPEELSGLRFYSIGRVAANKIRGSYLIEVTPVEKMPHLASELTDHVEKQTIKTEGNDSTDAYDDELDTSASEEAQWLPWGQTNRITAPDVRRGEYVLLFKFADTPIVYWTEFKAAHILRRLETVTWIFSNEREENKPLTEENVYTISVSTHDKHITISTTKSDGEPFAYTLQLNTKDGHFVLMDDVGNYIFLDSMNNRIRLENRDKTFVDLNMRKLFMGAIDLVDITTKDFVVKASQNIKMTTDAFNLTGSSYYAQATFTYKGNSNMQGNVQIDGSGRVEGNWYEGSSSGPGNTR